MGFDNKAQEWDPEVRTLLPPETEAVIESYSTKHRGTPEERAAAETFAKAVVRTVGVKDGNNATNLLGYLSEFGIWCQRAGITLDPRSALGEATIQRYVLTGLRRDTDTKRKSARAALRRVGRPLVPDLHPPEGSRFTRTSPSEPYTGHQIAEYLRLARTQPTERLRDGLTVLICGSAGAGLDPEAYRHLRGSDIRMHAGVVVCEVRGSHPRVVPVDVEYGETLFEIARRSRADYLIGGDAPTRRNVTNPLTARLHGGIHLPRLTASRLRATWHARKLEQIGFKEYCQAAGITQSPQVFAMLGFLPDPTLDEVIAAVWNG